MLRTVAALIVTAAINAQAGHGPNMGVATGIMSPTVVATWYVQQETGGTNRLELVILWRGNVAWWEQPGYIGGSGNTDYTIQYGSVRLSVRFDPMKLSATVNGHDIALRGDNVLYVDDVDSPGGPRFLRTSHIDPHMPGSFGQIGSLLANSDDVMDYMQCGARRGNPTADAKLALVCMTNLGRQ